MKYGIQAVRPDNRIQFCCSTRSSSGYFVDEITDTALFVQEKSAVEALKQMRLAGTEADGTQLFVIEVDFKVNRLISVERPAEKKGFILVRSSENLQDYEKRDVEKHIYFYGTKTAKDRVQQWGDPNMFGNMERATVFKSTKEAQARKDALIATANGYLEYEKNKGPSSNGGWRNPVQAQAYYEDNIKRRQKEVDDMSALVIKAYP